MNNAAIWRALHRVGIPAHYGDVENWIELDPPTWIFPNWEVRYRPFDWELDG